MLVVSPARWIAINKSAGGLRSAFDRDEAVSDGGERQEGSG